MSNVSSAIQEPLYSTLGADPDLGEIVELFVEEMPGRIEALVEQYNSGDWQSLRRTAHQLKGAAGSYGFEQVTPVAAELEQKLDQDEPEEQVRSAVEQLIDHCQRLKAGSPA
jgi:HPt (histidine-containing phosphotransfer) domain-containing protein